MRVLHAGTMSTPAAGVVRQMEEEQRSARALGLAWRTAFFVPSGTSGEICINAGMAADDRLAFRRAYYRWLGEAVRDCDVLLLRHIQYDPLQLPFMRRQKVPVLLVHHSLEGPEVIGAGGLKAGLQWLLESVFAPLAIRRADGIVSVTPEIARYEARRARRALPVSLIYPNGIGYRNYAVHEFEDDDEANTTSGPGNVTDTDVGAGTGPGDAPPGFLFVASNFAPWHGLDRLLDSVEASSCAFVLHVVGELNAAQSERLARDSRCRVHGVLDAAEIDALARCCRLGLAAFALDRKRLTEACTLKVREYLRAGLAVYSGHVDVFPNDAVFYRQGPCDIDSILAYADEIGERSRAEISALAQPYIDKEVLVRTLHAALAEAFDARVEKSASFDSTSASRLA